MSGVIRTIESIKQVIPSCEIIGADEAGAKSVLTLQVWNGPKIGVVGWTELMNHDHDHFKKGVIRETDVTPEVITEIKQRHDILIGFPHGNVEQSYSTH